MFGPVVVVYPFKDEEEAIQVFLIPSPNYHCLLHQLQSQNQHYYMCFSLQMTPPLALLLPFGLEMQREGIE